MTQPPDSLLRIGPSIFRETRTRILFLYFALVTLCTMMAIPLFYWWLFEAIDRRVKKDLQEEVDTFVSAYRQRQLTAELVTEAQLKSFIDDFVNSTLPEDDNFFLFYLNRELYKASPNVIPAIIAPSSPLSQQLQTFTQPTSGEWSAQKFQASELLYNIYPLTLGLELKGTFIAVHLTRGERQEALVGVYIFSSIACGVLLITFSLAWIGTGRLLKPVQTLAKTARSISETNLNQRIPITGTGEMAELADIFNNMMNRLELSFDSQRAFISDAGHELRTPITIIQGHLELMGDDPDEQQETLTLVMDELGRMGRMVNDLLVLTKSDRPDFLQFETIDLQAFLEALFMNAQTLAQRNWHLTLPGKGRLVADRHRLLGALLNLLNNAVQHTRLEDDIELGCNLTSKKVKFWVRDTGSGIAEADQAYIFERFARARNQYRQSDGSGLGLAIVKAIAEAHGGYVSLTSQLGVGSTFSLVLPLDPPQQAHFL